MTRESPVVIGPTLLDVLAFAGSASEGRVDRSGRIVLSVGGVATNVAVNLAELGLHPQLLSCFPQGSLICDLMKERLLSVGIDLRCPPVAADQTLPCFVGIFDGARLSAAVTSTISIPNAAWTTISDAIQGASIAVCDTNMSKDDLIRIAAICEKRCVPLAVVCASDTKATRLEWDRISPLALVSLNIDEAQTLNVNVRSEPTAILAQLGAEAAIISAGAAGATYFDSRGRHHIPPPQISDPSTAGAGDALFSTVCAQLVRGKDPVSEGGLAKIHRTLERILAAPGSNLRARDLVIY